MDSLERLGKNIKVMRVERGYTQEQLAEYAGMDPTYLGLIERGQKNLSVRILLQLASALQCEPAELLRNVHN
jgi:transcriptional regulator with XRE-family HTH domain